MADYSTQAKQARETLARALGALQSDPTVPPSLMDVAEPVAMAMGALHGIERTGALTTAPEARDHVRAALGKLQAQAATNHPAVDRAMEAVADSLGVIFGLVRAHEATAAAAAPAAAPVAAAPAPVAAPVQPAVVAPASTGAGASPYAPTSAGGAAAYVPPQPPPATFNPAADPFAGGAPAGPVSGSGAHAAPAQPAPAVQPASPTFQPASGYQAHDAPAPTAYQPSTVAAPAPPPVAQAPQQVAPQLAPKAAAGGSSDPFAAPSKAGGGGARPDGGVQRFEAALGISSATNFYKGLSGNDVIEHGGLFVATYNKVPPVGSPVSLRVILPGGFEFESMATVAWTRENSGNEAPGFGARFTQINAEAKQLVYRYVRNREPLFYDDL